MFLTGFADEAGTDLDIQIEAIKELGWNNIEMRNVGDKNLTLVDERTFENVCIKLSENNIHVNCFGSGIANWAKKLFESPESSYDEMKRAIPRMHRLETKFIRIMSFAVAQPFPLSDKDTAKEALKRLEILVKMAEDGGVVCVHENCSGWAGQSFEHTLRMLDKIQSSSLRLVFDTGNPIFEKDIRGATPYKYQDSLEFYNAVKDRVVYVHVKDGRIENGTMKYSFPGDGDGHVVEILKDLYKRGYDNGLSIEPHLAAVAHDPTVTSEAAVKYSNFVEYGKRMEQILARIGWKCN